MTAPGEFAPYFGFTEEEVKALCDEYHMSFEDAHDWYDGYGLVSHAFSGTKKYSMYSPKSVVEAMLRHKYDTYWNQTETYEALKMYSRPAAAGRRSGHSCSPPGGHRSPDSSGNSGSADLLPVRSASGSP